MKKRFSLVILVTAIIFAFSLSTATAQEATKEAEPAHKITAQEVAEALADPSATITYFNLSYRNYRDVGPLDDTNEEYRLNGAGFINLPGEATLLYRLFMPFYVTDFPFDDEGRGDLLLSGYLVPKAGTLILGYGAAMMVPTANEDYYGTGKWSAGPTLVIAKKVPGKYTVGGLLTHIWSFTGESDREDISTTTIQPAFTYFIGRGTSITLTSETTYNWEADEDEWQIPITAGVSQILPPFGKFFVGVGVAGTYYIEKSDNAPEWDVRAVVSVVFP